MCSIQLSLLEAWPMDHKQQPHLVRMQSHRPSARPVQSELPINEILKDSGAMKFGKHCFGKREVPIYLGGPHM